MGVSEIRVKQIRVNQGLGVYYLISLHISTRPREAFHPSSFSANLQAA